MAWSWVLGRSIPEVRWAHSVFVFFNCGSAKKTDIVHFHLTSRTFRYLNETQHEECSVFCRDLFGHKLSCVAPRRRMSQKPDVSSKGERCSDADWAVGVGKGSGWTWSLTSKPNRQLKELESFSMPV